MSRLRGASKASLAVAGILAVPLFFVGLMAFSLKLDKPSTHLTKHGTLALGDPTKGTVGTIYLLAFAVSAAVVLVGGLAMLLRSRLATIVPAVAGIVASVLLLLPLATLAAEHTKRYPLGVDNIPPKSASDIFLRGEWEQNARTTAHQIGLATIGIAIAAIAISVMLEIRRRRGIEGPAVPPPPEMVTAQADLLSGRGGEPLL
jgi:hypothetical protein